MDNPNSGNNTVDTSANLGDIGKLAFLDNFKEDPAPVEDTSAEVEVLDTTDTPAKDTEQDTTDTSVDALADDQADAVLNDSGVLSPNKSARDYSDIDPADVPLFKKMSNDSFAKAKEWYLNNRNSSNKYTELESNYNKIKDQQYWSHPEAYKLSEEYTRATAEYQAAGTISNYWTEALAALRNGQPVRELQVNDKGEFSLGTELQPSPQLEAKILQTLARTSGLQQQAEQKLASAKTSFSNRYKEFEGFLGRVESGLLGEVRKHPEFKKLEDGMLNMLPSELRGVRHYQLIAGMGAFIKALTGELNKMKSQLNGKKVVATAVKSGGPRGGTPAASGESNSVADVLKSFESLRGR